MGKNENLLSALHKVIAFSRGGHCGHVGFKNGSVTSKKSTLTSPPIPHSPISPTPTLLDINKWGILLLCFHQSFPSFISSPPPAPHPWLHPDMWDLSSSIRNQATPPAVEECSLNTGQPREVPRVFHLCIFIPLLSTENYKCGGVCVSVWQREMEREGEEDEKSSLKEKKDICRTVV